ncbi:MAG: carboxypeptidase-like regulatory domain-containing protein, partial [Bryobacteraceae bacterium]
MPVPMVHLKRGKCLFALLAILGVTGAWAQTSLGTSAVGGTVKDQSGLGVPAARVELIDVARGVSRETTANASGDYTFNAVTAGIYTLRVSLAGFETSDVNNVQVAVNQRATVDVSMKVGAVSESVQVNAEGETPLLETASNALGTVIDQRRVEDLPLNGRDFLQLGALSGGIATPSGSSDAVAGQEQHPDRSIIIAGNNQFQTSYLIDGIATRGSRLGESSLNLSISAIDQFKIQVGFFMPDQGPNPGIVDVITKGGANQFHGEAFEFLRNSTLDARNFYSPGPDKLQRNQFGGAFGGPVLIPRLFNGKDKLWFHADYEGTRQIQKFFSNAFTPTSAMFGGDFSVVPQTIYDPGSFDAATGKRQPFAGNVIPAARINPVSQKLLQYYLPGASYTQRPSNLSGQPKNTLGDNQFTIRVDTRISDRQSLFGNVTYENSPVILGSIMPLGGSSYPFDAELAVVQHTMTFGPHLVNIARIGFARSSVHSEGQGESGPDLLTPLGITGAIDQHGISGIGIQGFTGFGRSSGPLGDTDDNYQIDEGLNYTRGSHNFAFGAGLRYHRTVQQNSNANAVGSLSFQTVFTAQLAAGANGTLAPVTNTGNAFADFLTGYPLSGARDFPRNQFGEYDDRYHFYVQ